MDAECVDLGLEQVGERIINHLVPPEPARPFKSRCNDRDVEMTLAIPGALVSHVQVRLILDQKFLGLERLLQALPDLHFPVRVHGSTFRNGFTAVRA